MSEILSSDKTLYCSFCGKSQHEVKKLIAGPSVFICDECIDLCTDIIQEEIAKEPLASKGDALPSPQDIRLNLDQYVRMLNRVQIQKRVTTNHSSMALN